MDTDEMMGRIVAAGYAGVKIYEFGKGRWMGCLVRDDRGMTADTTTNLWDYAPSASAALGALAAKAEKHLAGQGSEATTGAAAPSDLGENHPEWHDAPEEAVRPFDDLP